MSPKIPSHLNLFQVNTTAFDEEDFLLLTDLTEDQVVAVIEPIVLAEREKDEDSYDNDMLVEAINKAYPSAVARMYSTDSLDLISI
jgi:hypothetical protein